VGKGRLRCGRFFMAVTWLASATKKCDYATQASAYLLGVSILEGADMKTAKIFRHGNSQAVRLPKDFRFDATEVIIEKAADVVLLIPKRHSAANLKEGLDGFKGPIDRMQPDAAEERNW
jgi:antitoxin VapB